MQSFTMRAVARKFFVGLVVLGVAAVSSLLQLPSASAVTGIVDGSAVTADPLPTVQIDGVVWKQQIAGTKVFAGGQFTNARPAGAAPGTNLVPRSNLLAYNIETGVLDPSFAPTVNGKIKAMALSPNGSTLYIGGSFTLVNGQNRYRVAAFNVNTGALLPWAPAFNSEVNSLVATGSAVFAGGQFNRVGSASRPSLAAVHPTSGALLEWAPTTNAVVQAIAITNDNSRIIVAGNFDTINGASNRGLGAISVATGAALPFPINQIIQNAGSAQAFLSLQIDKDDYVYGTGYAFGGGGPFFEGVFAADAMTGNVRWLADCHGDSYDAMRVRDTVYAVSHHHHCENISGFPEFNPRMHQRANAFTLDATGLVRTNNQGGYPNFGGNPAPTIVQWFPDVPAGTFTGQSQGGWTLTGNDDYLLMGGEFPRVNNTAQQGLVRFAVPSKATNKVGPQGYPSTLKPTLFQTSPTTARIAIPGTWDRDDLTLTYTVQRQDKPQPVATLTNQASFWEVTGLTADDTTIVPGTTYRYRVRVSDADGNSVTSEYVTLTTSANVPEYPAKVFADGADHYWQLGTSSPFTDLAGSMPLTGSGTITTEPAGAFQGSAASTFDGASSAGGTATITGPQTFSLEAWFKTTTTSGGKIVGFGNAATGMSSNYDRHIYMQNSGQLVFGTHNNRTQTITSQHAYNDGQWHHAVGTLSPTEGMVFYVDGLKVGTNPGATAAQPFVGRWRVGGDNLNGWPGQPSSNFFSGTIDEVAVYPTALTVTQVRSHYTAGGGNVDLPPAPTDAYGKAVFDDEPALQWRLNEASGDTAADTSPNGTSGHVSGGVTWGAASTVAPGTGIGLNGSDGLVATTTPVFSPQVYSTEIWFNTTTTSGGKIIGFGNQPSGSSSNYDRHVYMDTDGKLLFGIYDGGTHIITSPQAYNDGKWHHVVATQGPTGIKLYVDGQLLGTNPHNFAHEYNGYWRVGGDTPWLANPYFNGTVDEAAVYTRELSLTQIRTHYRASAAATNAAPTASIESTCDVNTCSFTATASDPDGTVATYAWDFGDGTTGTGKTATHSYAAAGTYTVTLTVTDDQGATGSTTAQVTSAEPPANQNPTASFTVTKSFMKATVDGSASSDPDGTVASYAWNFGDGTTATGATASHTYATEGTFTITLKVTDNQGGTATTTREFTASLPPNQAPTAAFTTERTQLNVAVDGSTSSDQDGTIAAYEWNFGDGATATGATATHTYAAAGTYTITLKVTDNRGGTDTKTSQVTVNTLVVADDFNRTGTTWGTADLGGQWTHTAASNFRTDGQRGMVTLPQARSSGAAYLNSVSLQDLNAIVQITPTTMPTGSGPQTTLVVRRIDSGTDYRVTYQLFSDGMVRINITKRVGGVATSMGDVLVSAFTFQAGDTINLRLEVTGSGTTTIRAKAWKTGTTEPTAPQMTRTDSQAQLQAPGSFGFVYYLSGNATAPISLLMDNLRIEQA